MCSSSHELAVTLATCHLLDHGSSVNLDPDLGLSICMTDSAVLSPAHFRRGSCWASTSVHSRLTRTLRKRRGSSLACARNVAACSTPRPAQKRTVRCGRLQSTALRRRSNDTGRTQSCVRNPSGQMQLIGVQSTALLYAQGIGQDSPFSWHMYVPNCKTWPFLVGVSGEHNSDYSFSF